MSFKPKYTDFDSAPMAFYNFIKYAIWVGIVIGFIQTISSIADFVEFNGTYDLKILYGLAIAIDSAVVIYGIIAASGLKNMEWNGVKAYYTMYIISIVGTIVLILYSVTVFGMEIVVSSPEMISQLIGNSVVFILVKIYFDKRKLLFSPYNSNIDGNPSNNSSLELIAESPIQVSDEEMDVKVLEEALEGEKETEPESIEIYKEAITSLPDGMTSTNPEENDSSQTLSESKVIKKHDEKDTERNIEMYDSIAEDRENIETDIADDQLDDEIKFCFKCGHKIGPEAVFCEKCGNRLR